MKFTCQKEILLTAVNSAIKAVSNKSSLPALECFNITASNNITITGYDLNMGIKSTFDANIHKTGSCLINAKLFSDILRKLPDDEIIITVSDDLKVNISCGKSIFDVSSLDASEFPEIPKVEKLKYLTLNGLKLREVINQTKFARSDNESKLIHTGFLFELVGNSLTVVCVDGFRLALRREPVIESTLGDISFVLPANSLIELEKLIDDEDNVTLFLDKNHILIEINNILLTTRLIDGDFLNYKNAIPSDFTTNIFCDTQNLKKSIERVSLIISEKIKTPIRFNFEDDILKISCITSLGKSYDEFNFDGEAESFEIGFNNKYLIDALTACPVDEAKLSFKGSLSPLIITPCDDLDTFLYLILPVRLKNND